MNFGKTQSKHSSHLFCVCFIYQSCTYMNSYNIPVFQLRFVCLFYWWGNRGSKRLIPCPMSESPYLVESMSFWPPTTLIFSTLSSFSAQIYSIFSTAQWTRPHYCHFKNKKRTSGRWLYEGHTGSLLHFDLIFTHKIELFYLWEIYWRNQIKLNVIKIMQE